MLSCLDYGGIWVIWLLLVIVVILVMKVFIVFGWWIVGGAVA